MSPPGNAQIMIATKRKATKPIARLCPVIPEEVQLSKILIIIKSVLWLINFSVP